MYEYDLHCLKRWRYRELKALCRQYRDLKRENSPVAVQIEECAMRADPADWRAIINNVAYGTGYERCASCQSMTRFYRARARFFTILNEERKQK